MLRDGLPAHRQALRELRRGGGSRGQPAHQLAAGGIGERGEDVLLHMQPYGCTFEEARQAGLPRPSTRGGAHHRVAMRRVSVIGASGSGKTTVGCALAARLGVPFVEMDELHWTQADWELPPLEEFRARVDEATQGASWVVDGSYGKARDIVWSRADTVVWLDLPFPLMLARTVRRTLARMRGGEPLWGIQRESFRSAFFSRDSLVLYLIRTQRRRARTYREWLGRPEYRHLRLIHVHSPLEVDRFLAQAASAERR